MPSDYRTRFFQDIAERSQIKLRVFETYLEPWASKVGSPRNIKRVWIVDGFAGPGTYDDGTPGSPALALDLADRLREASRSFEVGCIFFEKRRQHFKALEALCGSRANIVPVEGDFWSRLDVVTAFVQDDPCFLFVDPFGIRDLQFERLVEVINKLSKVDLMVNFMTSAVGRLEAQHPDYVSAAVGADDWTAATALDIFCDSLKNRCRFMQPATLPVRGSSSGMDYDLVLAARHSAAYELWNDQIVKEVERSLKSAGEESVVSDMRQDAENAAESILLAWAQGRGVWTRRDAIGDFAVVHCGEASASELRSVIGRLVSEQGPWVRERTSRGIDRDPLSWRRQ